MSSSSDKVSAAMGNYMLQGWALLNDGCPDCNTPLMRNREATNQICVNCELNPPVDPEETPSQEATPEAPAATEPAISAPITPPAQLTMTAPAPTSALPSVPGHGSFRPPSPVSHRTSVMDPMLEARRNLRPTGRLGGSPLPPSTPPPPRSSTPLPMPPMAPPPTSAAPAKPVSAPLGKASIPLPPGPPPATPLSPPPPPGTLMPQPVPRDMKRSPQSSIVISGNILPPSTPPPPPPNASDSLVFPTPPSEPPVVSAPIEVVHVQVEEAPSAQEPTKEIEEPTEAVVAVETVVTETVEQEEEEEEEEEVAILEPMDTTEDSDGESLAPSQASQAFVTAAIEVVSTEAQEQGETKEEEPRDDDDEDKGAESDDDFEDAEEEVYKPTEEEIKAREAKREQSERASRLIGQKMLQGWAMLQDPCPNADCYDKKEYCVVCENFFQREEDLEHGKYTIVPTSSSPEAPKTEEVASTTAPEPAPEPAPPAPLAPAPTSPAPPPPTPPSSEEIQQAGTAFQFPAPPSTQPPSAPAPPPQSQNPASVASPNIRASMIGSPYSSPSMGRSQRELHGRVSNSIILPPSLGMASQQILGKHLSEDFDKLASDDEETRKHMNIIRKVGEFSSKSLPPPPPSGPGSSVPLPPGLPPASSRPASTYSNSSGYHPNEDSRIYNHPSQRHAAQHQHQHQHQQHQHQHQAPPHQQYYHQNGTDANSPPPPPPLAPEVLALVSATHKTIATILVKLEAYRQALEVSENPKECQLLTVQIKGLMECLKACRETL
ncbi:hypothetical protein BG005_002354 [Podila minutissima]|nr:hypothetical protein BG005_002354 [Podila minutissima]